MENLPDDPDASSIPPWEMPGAFRRDCEPHRAGLLVRLAHISMSSGYLSVVLYFFMVPLGPLAILLLFLVIAPVLIALALGGLTYLLSRHDLARMERGFMDRTGQAATESARRNSATAVRLGALGGIIAVGLVLFVYWSLRV
jgi:hypothetical protein